MLLNFRGSEGFQASLVLGLLLIVLVTKLPGTQAKRSPIQAQTSNQTISQDGSTNGTIRASKRSKATTTTQKPKIQARISQQNVEPDDYRVPLWNIAHMINSIDQIEPALRNGANGIEVDVSFDKIGYPIEAYHGFPCDCGRHCHHRENLVKFVQFVAQITSPNFPSDQLQLVLFDLKLKDLDLNQKETAGFYLASILDEHLYRSYTRAAKQSHQQELMRPPVRVIISINHVTDNILVRSFIDYMRQNQLDLMYKQVGFDVGMNDNLSDISAMWNGLEGATFNVWQGDGLTNCANIVRGVERLKEAISIRNGQGHFRKIYYWTADVLYHIRSVLRLGLDAILTNQPQRVLQVLEEQEFKVKYRLATVYDDPFAQFWIKPSAWKMSAPSIQEAFETVSNIKRTSEQFVKTLPDGIAAALKKVHHTITSSTS